MRGVEIGSFTRALIAASRVAIEDASDDESQRAVLALVSAALMLEESMRRLPNLPNPEQFLPPLCSIEAALGMLTSALQEQDRVRS